MDYFILINQLDLISLHLEYREPSLISHIEDHKQGNNSSTRSTQKFHRKGTMMSTERGLGTHILNLIQTKLKNTALTRPNLTISHVNAHSVNNKIGTL